VVVRSDELRAWLRGRRTSAIAAPGGRGAGSGNVPVAVDATAHRRWPLALVLLAVAALACCAATGLAGAGLLHLLPALLMGCVLLARRYPGEAVLLRWAHASRPRRRPAGVRGGPSRALAGVPRGGLLIAFALAVRPPPRPLTAS
jgi:hypothetical protein